jgi:hypothetical protein
LGDGDQGDVVAPAGEGAALEMLQDQAGFQLAVAVTPVG